MELTRAVNGYCERLDPGYWAEPINAITNAGFVIAAVILWPRVAGLPLARALCVVLAAIGVGSYLFHTHAQIWAMIADVLPIGIFILLYIYVANRHYWELGPWAALALTGLFLPYAALLLPVFSALPFFHISAAYWPVPLLIAIYAILLRNRAPQTAKGLGIGAALLALSLSFRSLDMPLCPQLPVGTHFLWHLLNAVMLGLVIETYRAHMQRRAAVAAAQAQG
ncbi:MAG: ceramidase domain-containing protein [Mangrovicoccus sp.]|nr:ceramidase domain-containing protein [Mangrovicoccus sp.]